MSELALTFHCFSGMSPAERGEAGVEPWDVRRLEEYEVGPKPGSGAEASAKFLLSVWSPRRWKCGRFDILGDLGAMDPEHRAAVAKWMEAPWWP